MRFIRFFIFSILNITLFFLFDDWYEIIYAYHFREMVFIPISPREWLYIPIFLFQVIYQMVLIYEMLLKRFITKKLNYIFIVPIGWAIISFGNTPYKMFKNYPVPEHKIYSIMEKIQLSLENYRVEKFFYPKFESNFKKLIKKDIGTINSGYTTKGKNIPIKIHYLFDQIEPYTKDIKNYKAPSIIVSISSSGKKFWITAIVKSGYIKGDEKILSDRKGALVIKDDIMIRKHIRDKKNGKTNQYLPKFDKK